VGDRRTEESLEKGTMKVCVMRAPGTNCDEETKLALEASGLKAEIVHVNMLDSRPVYEAMVVPGGFSYGDHIRAGSVLAKKTERILYAYADAGRPILGICNGFQVLVEAGLLPGWERGCPQVALGTNDSARYECRWVYLRLEKSKNIFTAGLEEGKVLHLPVAHSEGKFLLRSREDFERLVRRGQLVFRYSDREGRIAGGKYPLNPNGSQFDIAGICDSTGTIFGLMPHPERAYWGWQLVGWEEGREVGDGKIIFDALASFLRGKI
jgi:phosphoribosylformylglycinamidine synthase